MKVCNILVTATHGSAYIPKEYENKISLNARLLLNFSDYATAQIVQGIPNTIICWFSRAIGDPNRDATSPALFRETDFNNIPVWKEPLKEHEKKTLVATFHAAYHQKIQGAIDELAPQLLIDVHDTGEWLLGSTKEQDTQRAFPQICLSNDNGKTCSPALLAYTAKLFKKHLELDCTMNEPYLGGVVCKTYAKQLPTLQIEFNRSLYMDERTQQILPQQMEHIRNGLRTILDELYIFLTSKPK